MKDGRLQISFDIGGVLSKYPHIFKPMIRALIASDEVDVWVITDMHEHEKAVKMVQGNGYNIPSERILSSNYTEHGEDCKAQTIEEHNIDVHVDDFPGYCAHTKALSLFTWPNPELPYFADDFVTDGKEGDFGRRRKKK